MRLASATSNTIIATFIIAASIGIGVGAIGVSVLAHTEDDRIHACVNNTTYVVHIRPGNGRCLGGETARHWNVKGPAAEMNVTIRTKQVTFQGAETIRALCFKRERVTGGGFAIIDNSDVRVNHSAPVTTSASAGTVDGWLARVDAPNSDATVTVYAICVSP